MKPIISPIESGNSGPEVRNLQDALLLLIVKGLLQFPSDSLHQLMNEQQASRFGSNTQRAVTLFQQQHQLNQTGEVDAPTAEALNKVLKEIGALDDARNGQKWVVAGQVVQEDNAPFKGEVILFAESDQGSISVSEDATNPEGRYNITYEPILNQNGVKLRVAAFDSEDRQRASATIETPKPVQIVNLNVPRLAPTYRVNGKVTSDSRAGVGELRVEIVDKNIGADVRLAQQQTGADGSYAVSFSYNGSKQQPDLQARVFTGDKLLGTSDVRYNATQSETLNVTLTAPASEALPSEHETLTAAIRTHTRENLRVLEESDDRQDITFLANKTGWDARAVALAALADEFSARSISSNGNDSQIAAPFFYALFRAGLPANEDALYQVDAKTAVVIWKKAIEQGVIPATLADAMPKAEEHFHNLTTQRALNVPVSGGISSLKEMLLISSIDDENKQRQFADIYMRHRADSQQFWAEVRNAFGETAEKRLKLDGQLAKLTQNNASLMRKVHDAVGGNFSESVQLVQHGFFRPEKWQEAIGNDSIPPTIPGSNDAEKRARYAELLSAQVRLSFPTAVVAELVNSEATPLAAAQEIRDGVRKAVHTFLTDQNGKFEIGIQPVEQFIQNNPQISFQLSEGIKPKDVIDEVKRIQRVYQITPSDTAMNALLNKGVHSAYAAVRYNEGEFVDTFKDDLGGEAEARLTYAKAQQVHLATLNIATSYLLARTAPGIGGNGTGRIVNPEPTGLDPEAVSARDVIAYPTVEGLFGEMDYCECEHCRSILSPAAYLVDLLQFIDVEEGAWTTFLTKWKAAHGGAPYPFADVGAWNAAGTPLDTEITPLQVLLSRRPDVQHLPLTCENTNTPLPYIDVVNETLEYYVAKDLKLEGYQGHSTDSNVKSEDLLASPQFVNDAADNTLAGAWFPPLPFHRSLENLRRYFDRFNTPLSEVMEKLRKDESVDRASADGYSWRDILMEELGLSRAEHRILTHYDPPDNTHLTLQQLYGYDSNTTDELINAKNFVRLVGITYEELTEILKTRFINVDSMVMLPRLERLGVSFARLKELKESNLTGEAWLALLPQPLPDASKYSGSIEGWVKNDENFGRLTSLITLFNPVAEGDLTNFDQLELRYTHPDNNSSRLHPVEFSRLIRFIRLWKKLGWTIEQTDKAIVATYPGGDIPAKHEDRVNLERLDSDFRMLLPRLAVLKRIMKALNLTPDRDLLSLLACYAWIYPWGESSLYKQMFLSPTLLKLDPVFGHDGYGGFLAEVEVSYSHSQPILEQPILDAASGRIAYDDVEKRLRYTGSFNTETRDALKAIPGVSTSFQTAVDALYAAKRLINHTETLRGAFQLTETEMSQILSWLRVNASTELDMDIISSIFRLGWLPRKLKLSVREFFLLMHFTGIRLFDPVDPPAPPLLQFINFIHRVRAAGLTPSQALYLIWNQDISGKSKPEIRTISDLAAGLRTAFTAIESELAVVDDPDGSIARNRMALVYGNEATDFFFGLLENTLAIEVAYDHDKPELDQAILNVAPGRIAYDDFRKRLSFRGRLTEDIAEALKNVNVNGQPVSSEFKVAVDELLEESQKLIGPFFARYPELIAVEQQPSILLATLLPELKQRRKRQKALEMISTTAKTELEFTIALLDDAAVLHAWDSSRPALDDFLAIETTGLTEVSFTNPNGDVVKNWSGYLEAPESGFFNLNFTAPTEAVAVLNIDWASVPLDHDSNGVWTNKTPIDLRAGTLYRISITIEKASGPLNLSWENPSRGREVIPSRYLYSLRLHGQIQVVYIRFLIAASLAKGLRLTAKEIAHLTSHEDYRILAKGWLNSLTVNGDPGAATSKELLRAFMALLDFARIKAELAPNDETLLAVLKDPVASTQSEQGLLFKLTRWTPDSLTTLRTRFNIGGIRELSHLNNFCRVYDAHVPVKAMGISAAALISATTNEPTSITVHNLQSALRARYDAKSWLTVLKPINDEMRGLQRDALVTYILHRFSQDAAKRHIDTPDKLFEFFLMDVQMEPCMQTSRIRHALSSIQLFIDRSLMNLEPRVLPSIIDAKQWEWMQRYRVWEANRKVFIWPENWLEPELRDDQSPFFKETMSELLQSDITEESAATALLNYLAKLEEVAKLEPCGFQYLEQDHRTLADDITHVVARTPGAKRKYFYRRREYGSWTPWEPIALDIEDNPVIPVVWNGRLLLFWLRVIQKPISNPPQLPEPQVPPQPVPLTSLDSRSLIRSDPPTVNVYGILCWSEYYNGKWQPSKTSDINNPASLGTVRDPSLQRSDLILSVRRREESGALRLVVGSREARSSFLLFNTHSLPVLGPVPANPIGPEGWHHLSTTSPLYPSWLTQLSIGFLGGSWTTPILENLKDPDNDQVIESQYEGETPRYFPFFYWDTSHVFYVRAVPGVNTSRSDGYGVSHALAGREFAIPPLVLEETYIKKQLATPGTIRYADKDIGLAGVVSNGQLVHE